MGTCIFGASLIGLPALDIELEVPRISQCRYSSNLTAGLEATLVGKRKLSAISKAWPETEICRFEPGMNLGRGLKYLHLVRCSIYPLIEDNYIRKIMRLGVRQEQWRKPYKAGDVEACGK